MKRTMTIKPILIFLVCSIAIPFLIILSAFDGNPTISLVKIIVGYVLLILVPLVWILYIAYHHETLNRKWNRRLTWRSSLIPVLIIIAGTLVIALVSQIEYFTNLEEQRFRDLLYFFTFVIVISLIVIAVNIADNQNYYSKEANLRSMSYLIVCLLIYLGPIGLLLIHRRLNLIQLRLTDM